VEEKMEKINRRKSQRRRPRTSVKIECRKGAYGLGPNLASGALDVSDTGARLIITQAVDAKGEVEIIISAYGMSKPIKRMAVVRWQVALADGGFCIGAEFQKRIDYRDWQNLAAAN
jgi:hypothetical protein